MEHEDFVTFEQAKMIKDLGFDWDCNHFYYEKTKEFTENYNAYSPEAPDDDCSAYEDLNGYNGYVSAPTLAQAQKWLMDKKCIIISIRPNDFVNDSGNAEIHYTADIFGTSKGYLELLHSESGYETYEFALEDGINEVLELL